MLSLSLKSALILRVHCLYCVQWDGPVAWCALISEVEVFVTNVNWRSVLCRCFFISVFSAKLESGCFLMLLGTRLLLVPVQLTVWKVSSPKWLIVSWVERWTLLTILAVSLVQCMYDSMIDVFKWQSEPITNNMFVFPFSTPFPCITASNITTDS